MSPSKAALPIKDMNRRKERSYGRFGDHAQFQSLAGPCLLPAYRDLLLAHQYVLVAGGGCPRTVARNRLFLSVRRRPARWHRVGPNLHLYKPLPGISARKGSHVAAPAGN